MKKQLFILFLFLNFVLRASETELTNLTSSDGLSNSSVNCLFQDSDGLIWLGTWDGLNSYNGNEFRTYKPLPGISHSISNNIIRNIMEENKRYLWIATDRGINRLDKTGNKFDRFFTETNRRSGFGENAFFVAKNNSNRIFALVYERGLYYFDTEQKLFFPIKISGNLRPKQIFFDLDDNLWILDTDKVLWKVVFQKGNSEMPLVHEMVKFSQLANIETAFCKNKCEIWLQTTNEQIFKYKISEAKLVPVSTGNAKPGMLKSISFANNFQLWGSNNGLFRYIDSTSELIALLPKIPVLSVLAGSQDIVWAGTDAQGVFQIALSRRIFSSVNSIVFPALGKNPVRAFHEDKNGILWIGTKGNGLLGMQMTNKLQNPRLLKQFTTANGLINNAVFTIQQGKGGVLWIGTDGNGINYFDPSSASMQTLALASQSKIKLSSVYALHFTNDTTLWAGTSGNGLYKLTLNFKTKPIRVVAFKQYAYHPDKKSVINNNIVYAIQEAGKNQLLIGTRGGGLTRLNFITEKFETYRFSDNNPDLIGFDDILSLHYDKKGIIWAGTSMGLLSLQFSTDGKPMYRKYTEADGLPNNTVHGIISNSDNCLWISTNKGIARFIPQQNNARIISYYQKDGLHNDEFSDGAYYKSTRTNKIYFGGVNGFSMFHPNDISNNSYMPPLVLDAFYVDNNRVKRSDYTLKKDGKDILHISYKINSFSFKFLPIDYLSGNKCEISYMLKGYHKDWIHIGTTGLIVFTNLPKGKYELKVRASNADKIWNNTYYSLPLEIQPPWWDNNIAYICYFVLFLLVTFGINRIAAHQQHIKNEIRNKELEQQKTEEIHQAKLRFFTNIAHEFSNSLTLIYGPCIQLLKSHSSDSGTRKHATTIKLNSERMQRLIQQLIEFRKAETGYLKPVYHETDIVELIKYVADNFAEEMEEKNIFFQFKNSNSKLVWNTDRDYVEKIIFNLLSNAVKYTPAHNHIDIKISADGANLILIVKNTGVGIKSENLNGVFNRFEVLEKLEQQMSQGIETRNGIGLALCKNLTDVLGGEISVESDGESYTLFQVTIPFVKPPETTQIQVDSTIKIADVIDGKLGDDEKQNVRTFQPIIPDTSRNGLILIVDDEQQIRSLVGELLSKKFEIAEAADGQQAIEIMRQRLPSLIICDVIMPGMNGVDFVRIMKRQELTRHIPVILLSSKSSVDHQIEGLETGADAYIGKPFHPRHLEAVIDSLLKRKKDVLEFGESAYSSVEQFDGKLIKKEDKELITHITKLVLERIDDESLSIESIAAEMAISKMQLYRKIKELIDQTPTEFIRTIRLNYAEKQLKTTHKTVQEIMYDCGFNNKTYFYREFAKKFKKTPKEYRNINIDTV